MPTLRFDISSTQYKRMLSWICQWKTLVKPAEQGDPWGLLAVVHRDRIVVG